MVRVKEWLLAGGDGHGNGCGFVTVPGTVQGSNGVGVGRARSDLVIEEMLVSSDRDDTDAGRLAAGVLANDLIAVCKRSVVFLPTDRHTGSSAAAARGLDRSAADGVEFECVRAIGGRSHLMGQEPRG